jgi:predicted RNA-binding protein with TRAM domain
MTCKGREKFVVLFEPAPKQGEDVTIYISQVSKRNFHFLKKVDCRVEIQYRYPFTGTLI